MTVLPLMSFSDIDVSASSLFSSCRVETWTEGASGQIYKRVHIEGYEHCSSRLLTPLTSTTVVIVVVVVGGGGFVVLTRHQNLVRGRRTGSKHSGVTEKAKPVGVDLGSLSRESKCVRSKKQCCMHASGFGKREHIPHHIAHIQLEPLSVRVSVTLAGLARSTVRRATPTCKMLKISKKSDFDMRNAEDGAQHG